MRIAGRQQKKLYLTTEDIAILVVAQKLCNAIKEVTQYYEDGIYTTADFITSDIQKLMSIAEVDK